MQSEMVMGLIGWGVGLAAGSSSSGTGRVVAARVQAAVRRRERQWLGGREKGINPKPFSLFIRDPPCIYRGFTRVLMGLDLFKLESLPFMIHLI